MMHELLPKHQEMADYATGQDFPETMLEVDHYTKNRQNRNVLDVAKAQNTVNSSAQQKTALARNVTRRATTPHIVFQKCIPPK